jgi:hypothetical protein
LNGAFSTWNLLVVKYNKGEGVRPLSLQHHSDGFVAYEKIKFLQYEQQREQDLVEKRHARGDGLEQY